MPLASVSSCWHSGDRTAEAPQPNLGVSRTTILRGIQMTKTRDLTPLERFWLLGSAVVVIAMVILMLHGHRSLVNWLVLAGAFANFMTFFLLWRARSRAG